MKPRWIKTWLRDEDVICVRCRRFCGPEYADVYVYEHEGMVCDACHGVCECCEGRGQVPAEGQSGEHGMEPCPFCAAP